jgi:hypothetical protein
MAGEEVRAGVLRAWGELRDGGKGFDATGAKGSLRCAKGPEGEFVANRAGSGWVGAVDVHWKDLFSEER